MARYLVAYGFLTRGMYGEIYRSDNAIMDADRVTPELLKKWELEFGRASGHSGTRITGFFRLDEPEQG